MGRALVIRITSKAGRSRVEVDDEWTFAQLKEQISQQLSVPAGEVVLCVDRQGRQAVAGDHRSLRQLGLTNGIELQLTSATAPSIAAVTAAAATHMTTADLPPEPKAKRPKEGADAAAAASSSSSTAAAPQQPPSTSEASPSKGPNFKSFDQHVKDLQYNTSELPLMLSFKPQRLEKGRMTKVPLSVTLKHQAYRHVDHLEFMNLPEVNEFVRYWNSDLGMSQQRAGIMYGYFIPDSHYEQGIRAVVEAIYEPVQASGVDSVHLLDDDPLMKTVDRVARRLKLQKIGWIFTHLPRDTLLSSDEVCTIARMQLENVTSKHYTGYPVAPFVTCTITPCAQSGGEPVPNAYMVSDMGMAFLRDGILGPSPDPSHLRLRQRNDASELFPLILESGKETEQFDADWLVVRVNESAPKKVKSLFAHSKFPRINRKPNSPQPRDVRTYLQSVSDKSPAARFGDFHLLLYIASLFDVDTAYAFCDCIVGGKTLDPAMADVLQSIG